MEILRMATSLAALLATGAMFGFFFAWSVTVMPGLGHAGGTVAVRAMQAINASIATPLFGAAFFGGLALPLLAAAVALAAGQGRSALLMLGAALAYGLGVFLVTVVVNVPMNNALARLAPPDAEAAAVWQRYAVPWTRWNHLRTVASGVAMVLAAYALTGLRAAPPAS